MQLAGLLHGRPREQQATDSDRSYGRRLSSLSILTALDVQLDVIMSAALLGTREAGIVAVARMIPTIPRRIWEVAYQPFFVKMAGDLAGARAVVNRYRLPLVGAFAAVAVVGIATAPFVIPALFGSSFQEAVLLTQFLLAANTVRVIAFLDEIQMKAVGDARRLSAIYVVLPLVSLVTLPPLVSLFGISGVGVRALVAASVYAVLTYVLGRRTAASPAT